MDIMNGAGYYLDSLVPGIIKDDRFAKGWTVNDGYMVHMYTAYWYNITELKDEYITAESASTRHFDPLLTNNDIQFAIHVQSLDNMFYIFHKYQKSIFDNANTDIDFVSPPTTQVENMGMTYFIQAKYQKTHDMNVRLLSHPKLWVDQDTDNEGTEINVTRIGTQKSVVVQCESDSLNQEQCLVFAEKVAEAFDQIT